MIQSYIEVRKDRKEKSQSIVAEESLFFLNYSIVLHKLCESYPDVGNAIL